MKKISSGQKNLHIAKGQLNSEWIYEVIINANQKLQGFLPYQTNKDHSQKTAYSHLFNKRGGWNKRGGGTKVAKSLNVEAGINVEGGIFGKN